MMRRVGQDVAGSIQMEEDVVILEQWFMYKGHTEFLVAMPTAQLGAFCDNVLGWAHGHGVVHDVEPKSSTSLGHMHDTTGPDTEAIDTAVQIPIDLGHGTVGEYLGVTSMVSITVIDLTDMVRLPLELIDLVRVLLVAATELGRQHPKWKQCRIMML
ncbi:hypothetical protein DHEL01_v213066 [Diaporthe helianthi]|uniref:Uncharacterized protein n=1 Tax=Diaporthe helianthi TaxID=158607 RepID=A0A2P5HE81_DIAHE|nr:hypothetical protein DHEL01_v213066 [Diaporthe helianthi]